MISRRVATFLLGIWIGCCVLVDLLALQTGSVANQFLDNGDDRGGALVAKAGKENLAIVLHHVSLEQTRVLLGNWELAQLLLAIGIGILAIFSDQKKRLPMLMCLAMAVIVAGQAFLITPQWADVGRGLDWIAESSAPAMANRMAMFAQTYAGLEAVKLLIGGGLASYFFAMESTVKRSHRSRSSSRRQEAVAEAPVKPS
jgi:hypothetical protein